ncbi:n-carbamyl-d-amino acid amidohydrolase [Grosmannia clavigera kw1407]|uniref:N-carbamyl-d-amino acid amidohydrolase n=1 Tax=Grosmannia clavigera (strain kw1407 / UAMH 11150) TaxID=655863 RepID=F0XG26_GROCL|nr:n-carbamyl-d-amino acid amidohydrolase [Grosmannia clavigera kw1407]EFX03385.1 n-carbamyl-d-amino acid amidohydrolase [Grosmannia clavigera kw1407]
MARSITVAAAQMGPIPHEAEPGGEVVRRAALDRMLVLLEDAARQGARLVVFPELALTTFFPRALLTDAAAVAAVFEAESPAASVTSSPHLQPLFARAVALGVDVSLGYAERWTPENGNGPSTDFNTAVYFSATTGDVVAKYRKVHLPGRTTLLPAGSAQQLEKRYFAPGDLGFQAFRVPGLVAGARKAQDEDRSDAGDPIIGMLICNDRRWPEAWRCYGLQGVELVLCGFNTTDYKPQEAAVLGDAAAQEALALLHHHISCQGGSYANACFSIHVAKAGVEADGPGGGLIAGTVIYDPLGRKVAESTTKGDELLVATLDLDLCRRQKETIFNFASHRRVEHYRRLVDQVGVVEPPLLSREAYFG